MTITIKSKHGQEWVKQIPQNLVKSLLTFEAKYHEFSLSCVWFVSRSQFAKELLESSPFFMWLILRVAIKNKLPEDQVLEFFKLKRRKILPLDELPEEQRLVKFFERLDREGIAVKEYDKIKSIIQRYGSESICRFKTISDQNLRLIDASPELLRYPFFQKLRAEDDTKNVLMLLGDTKVMGHHLDEKNLEKKLQKCKSIQDLKKLHNEYMLLDRNCLKNYNVSDLLPPPPILGNQNIQHIRFKKDLIYEGELMNHCVASYYSDIKKRQYYVYRIMHPERATIGIHLKNNKWVIDQLMLVNNKKASKKTRNIVDTWLKNVKHF